MIAVMKHMLCRLLMVLVAWTPFQVAYAGMIDTGQAVASTSQTDRAALLNFVDRAEVSNQLQSLGLDPMQAKQRVQAMSDQEITALAQKVDLLPAGAHGGPAGFIAIVLVVLAIWWYVGVYRK